MRPIEAKISAIWTSLCQPTGKLCGIFSVWQHITEAFSVIFKLWSVHKLNCSVQKKSFVWSSECQQAFESAKSLLSHCPVPTAPDLSRPFKLEVDASVVGVVTHHRLHPHLQSTFKVMPHVSFYIDSHTGNLACVI